MKTNLAYRAMVFAREAHKNQFRKYTGNPYFDHLAEVAGISMSVGWQHAMVHPDVIMATAWLHDCIEDQNISDQILWSEFGSEVAFGVRMLSDLEVGSRSVRKVMSRIRLSDAPGWVQTIKCADLISNTSSIVMNDPKFAVTYLEEKRLLLDVMTKADRRLWDIAMGLTA